MRTFIAALLNNEVRGKLWILDLYIHKALSEDVFIVSDGRQNILLDISACPDVSKDLVVGKCFRFPKPYIEKDILRCGLNAKACPIKQFEVPKLTKTEAAKFVLVEEDVCDMAKLEDICNVTSDTTAKPIYLKVIFIGNDKMSQFSKYRLVKVRDINNDRHFVQLFGDLRLQVEKSKVYKFSALMVQNYRKDTEEWGRMRNQRTTRITAASEETAMLFAGITAGDVTFQGVVLAHEKIDYYECCSSCTRKNFDQGNGKCIFCAESIPKTEAAHDFSVIFIVGNESEDELRRFLVFRSQLNLDFNRFTERQVQDYLEQRHTRPCLVEYDTSDGRKGNVIKAEAFTFPPCGKKK